MQHLLGEAQQAKNEHGKTYANHGDVFAVIRPNGHDAILLQCPPNVPDIEHGRMAYNFPALTGDIDELEQAYQAFLPTLNTPAQQAFIIVPSLRDMSISWHYQTKCAIVHPSATDGDGEVDHSVGLGFGHSCMVAAIWRRTKGLTEALTSDEIIEFALIMQSAFNDRKLLRKVSKLFNQYYADVTNTCCKGDATFADFFANAQNRKLTQPGGWTLVSMAGEFKKSPEGLRVMNHERLSMINCYSELVDILQKQRQGPADSMVLHVCQSTLRAANRLATVGTEYHVDANTTTSVPPGGNGTLLRVSCMYDQEKLVRCRADKRKLDEIGLVGAVLPGLPPSAPESAKKPRREHSATQLPNRRSERVQKISQAAMDEMQFAAEAPNAGDVLNGATGYKVGDRVAGLFKCGQIFYCGYVSGVNNNGTVDIKYDDGNREVGVPQTHVQPLCVGDSVLAQWNKTGEAYHAVITEVLRMQFKCTKQACMHACMCDSSSTRMARSTCGTRWTIDWQLRFNQTI